MSRVKTIKSTVEEVFNRGYSDTSVLKGMDKKVLFKYIYVKVIFLRFQISIREKKGKTKDWVLKFFIES